MIKQHVSRGCAYWIDNGVPTMQSRIKRRESTLWQRRFWEHLIRDEQDLSRHVDYVHYNPVIVVDTDAFVSALGGGGAANEVVANCLRGRFLPLMGVALFAEYESLLLRPRLFTRSRLSGAEQEDLFDIFLAACRWTRVYYAWRPNLRDEDDNHVVELAVAGAASAIVTRNVRDFRIGAELKFPQLKILTPAQLLRGEP